MVRVIIKGGVWKNTEDEILKAAIMKYGKNQWSRIASLLHRKSAKQCKARWYEWLDPRIKKTEWSREEDEKLLHLAKIMPTQWRTIAPIVGRTAAQCLERYEYLLDEAQRRAEGVDEADTMKEAKKLKPGDVDPTPETKPARPDPIDMDEDELEMLSEARARLANTQGKKAKRKAREKQLGEARRLASLQKRRELRAAGIMIGSGWAYKMRKHRLLDYNAERTMVEDRRRDWQERDDRRKDKDKLRKRKQEDAPQSIFSEKHEKKRSKLLLPEPQISDKELDDIIKIGHASDSVRELVDDNPSSTLLHDYNESSRINAVSARTQRTPAGAIDTVARAADDLLALTNVETPLKGGLNTPLHTLDFSAPGSTRQPIATPNTVLSAVAATPKNVEDQTPGTQRSLDSAATPGGASTVPGTPFRDQLNINPSEGRVSRKELQKQFQTLPKPRNEFELAPIGEDEEETDALEEWAEDAAELDERRAALLAKKKELELQKRTRVFQRGLPLPSKLNPDCKKRGASVTEMAKADDLIKAEMYTLMEWDAEQKEPSHLYTREEREKARKMIEEEATKMAEEEGIEPVLDSHVWQVIANCSSELVRHQNRFNRLQNLHKREQIEVLSDRFKTLFNWMQQQAHRVQKVEKRVKVKLGGYINIHSNLHAKLDELHREKEKLLLELKTFHRLEENEQKAIVKRTNALTQELREQEEREKHLQKHFSHLQHRKWELEQTQARERATVEAEPVRYASFESAGRE
uniref:Uncharacterized protein n=1 Tax=Globodera rostochiensis TaxID=31243 RepID=A0A914GQH6_GLORO